MNLIITSTFVFLFIDPQHHHLGIEACKTFVSLLDVSLQLIKFKD